MARGDGSKLIWYSQPNIYGRHFQCSKRTGAHLDWTKKQLAKRAAKDKKNYYLKIIQGCTNTGVSASAGTHDYDAVLDVEIVGMTWAQAQRFLRSCGWAAFWRKPPTFSLHIHMVSLPAFMLQFVARVGVYVPGQVQAYYAKPPRDGLADQAPDRTWHPKDIRGTIFQYQAYQDALSLQERLGNLQGRLKAATKENAKRTVDNVSKLIRETKAALKKARDRNRR